METTTTTQELSVIEKSVEVFKKGGQILEANQARSMKAVAVGKQILEAIRANGMTPELDERAMNYLANCSKALKEMNEARSEVTVLMDEIKKLYTTAEAAIDVKKDSTYAAQIQNERNEYARKLAEEQKKKEEEAKRKAEEQKQGIEYRAAIEKDLTDQFYETISAAKRKINDSFNAATLNTIAEFKTKIETYEPKFYPALLKRRAVAGLFNLLAPETQNAIFEEVLEERLADFSSTYEAEMSLSKQDYLDKVPSKIAELTEAAETEARIKKEAEEAAERERQRKIEMEKANEAERKRLEEIAEKEREEERKRLDQLAEEQRLKDEERKRREAEEAARIQQEEQERKDKEALEIQAKAEGEKTMVLFNQVAETAVDVPAPETRQGYEITVTHQAGYAQLFQLWFEQEAVKLPLDKIEKTSFGQIKAWAEKRAHKLNEKIESKFLTYKETYKAVNRKKVD